MSLDGLRAWIAEVERKLGKRTRVFLALAVIAIGIAGAAVYLAIDARESSVSESDLQTLQDELAAQGGVGTGTGVAQLEAELAELRTQVEQLESGGGGSADGGASDSGGTGDDSDGAGSNSPPGGAAVPGGGVPGGAAADPAQIQKLLEETKKKNEEAEREQAGE
jgi:hypothetical protein